MNRSMNRRHSGPKRLVQATVSLGLVVITGATAEAGAPAVVPLNPEPPASYTCTAIGTGTRCLSDTTTVVDPVPSGLVCPGFEVVDQGTRRVKAERWYDVNGDLVKRVRANIFSEARLSNPLTGASVSYDQHDIDTDVFAVPGDLTTGTTSSVESLVAVAPGYGAVLVNKGRSVTGPDGTLLSRTGRRDFDAYFGGDTSVLEPLCSALSD